MDWINPALVNTVMYLWLNKMHRIWLAEKPLDSEEGLCSRQFTVGTINRSNGEKIISVINKCLWKSIR
jgi:hypothetical protein